MTSAELLMHRQSDFDVEMTTVNTGGHKSTGLVLKYQRNYYKM
jgi:hypothetical protein